MTQRMRKRLTIELFILTILAGFFLGHYIPEVLAKRSTAYDFVGPLVGIRNELVKFYVDVPDEQAMLEGAIDGMIDTLDDPYTNYFTAEQLESFEKHTRGTFTGIGAEISKEGEYIVIVSPLEDSPAFKAGLVAGDTILAVDGESIKGVSTEEAIKRITGPEGTDVKLTVRHEDATEAEITVTRGRIIIQTVKGLKRDDAGHWDYLLDGVDKIGYIRMTQFSEPTAAAMTEAIKELKKQGMKGLILDLRYNPGGLLDSAIKIADMFLAEGTIVSTKGRRSPERSWAAENKGLLQDMPMMVMINEASASASEILAGALKYNHRAIIVGTRSVGKGSVQQIVPLQGGAGGIKLTTSLYYMPNGQNIHRREGAERWGVDPSDGFYVAMTYDQRRAMAEKRLANGLERPHDEDGKELEVTPQWVNEHMADPQLSAALKSIKAKLKTGEWEKVGPGDAVVLAHLAEREALINQRDRYQERLDEIQQEIERINRIVAGIEVPAKEPEGEAAEVKKPAEQAAETHEQVEEQLETVPAGEE